MTAKSIYFNLFDGKVQCNICGWKDARLESDSWHPETICPQCMSQVRQRLFVGIMEQSTVLSFDNLIANKKVLHFAPDKGLTNLLKPKSAEYLTADFLAEGYEYQHIDYNIDMSKMESIQDKQFDCVIAFDVLEHIPDHMRAIQETHRILKKGGYCFFTVPQQDGLDHTIEDLETTDPKERERKFGQFDHWRIYGADFKDMIASKGFEVQAISKDSLDDPYVARHVLHPPVLSDNPSATNHREVFFGKKQ